MTSPREQTADGVEAATAEAARRTAHALHALRQPEGCWCVPPFGGAAFDADSVLLEWWVRGNVPPRPIVSQQVPEGGFSLYPGGPAHLDTSIKAYVALRLAGMAPDERLRAAILRLGGVDRAGDAVRLLLSLLGLIPRERCVAPSEMVADRAVVIPLTVLWERGVRRPVGFEVSELLSGTEVPRRLKSVPRWLAWFRRGAIRQAEEWLLARKNSLSANVYGMMALHALGHDVSVENSFSRVRQTALAALALGESGYGADLDRSAEWLAGHDADLDTDTLALVLSATPHGTTKRLLASEPDCPDTTGRVLEALCRNGVPRDDPAIASRVEYLFRTQEQDGSWRGRWGVNYVYGTCHALRGLQAAGVSDREAPVLRGGEWLRSVQNADSGWGESCASDAEGMFVPASSTPSQTAWALVGLLAGGDRTSLSVNKGIEYLVETQLEDGTWDERLATATEVPNALYWTDPLYRNSFPLLALSSFLKSRREVAHS